MISGVSSSSRSCLADGGGPSRHSRWKGRSAASRRSARPRTLAHPFAQHLGGHAQLRRHRADRRPLGVVLSFVFKDHPHGPLPCLLYTSDAADDLLCVDLGGRRIIKKKKKIKK